jgi:hypothetical protein
MVLQTLIWCLVWTTSYYFLEYKDIRLNYFFYRTLLYFFKNLENVLPIRNEVRAQSMMKSRQHHEYSLCSRINIV